MRPACRGSICPRAESTRSSAPACTTTTTSPRWSGSCGRWRDSAEVRRQKAPRLVEALRRGMLVVAGMSAHREAMSGALIELELADLAERPHPGFHPTHIRNRGPLIVRAVQNQGG